MKSKKVFFWACDYKTTSGEGRLARLFVKKYKKKINTSFIKLTTPKCKFLNYKYITPFIGILYAWIYFFKKRKFLYLNYLPYWNFFIFLFLPPNCDIGPITGGAKFSKNSKDYLIRKYIFPICYFLSNFILNFRFQKLVFSTELLKKNVSKKIIKKSKFNFIFNEVNLRLNKINNKKTYFLFYFRKHKNKDYSYLINFIKKINLRKKKIHVIGDKLKLKGVINHGYVSHKKVLKLLKNTKYSFCSSENIYSFFTIDCINNNVKILINHQNFRSVKYFKNSFIKFNFKDKKYKF